MAQQEMTSKYSVNERNSCYFFCICEILNDHIYGLIFWQSSVVTLLNFECEMFGEEALCNWVSNDVLK